MIYQIDEILKILQNSTQSVPLWISEQRKINIELEALVNGIKHFEQLYKIEHKEDDDQLEARKRYSHSIKDLFDRVLRPLDNIYSSTGGTKYYGYKDEENEQEFDETPLLKALSRIRDGKPLEKWLQNNWMKLYHTDPNGLIFYEYKSKPVAKAYPTYKNIGTVRDYITDGQRLEWVLFEGETSEDNKTISWRFVDDACDYTFIQNVNKSGPSSIFKIDKQKTFKHPFGYCPGIVISDIHILGTEKRKSAIDSVMELAKESLRDESHKSMFKFLLWDPIFWRYAQKCPKCNGAGRHGTGQDICDMCNGVGIYAKKDITDIITIAFPEDKEIPTITPNIAGYIFPDVNIMGEFNKELELLEDKIFTTIWGTNNYNKIYNNRKDLGNNPTATQIVYDTAPQISRLNNYADTAEWTEWYLSELEANFIYLNKPADKEVCTIFYGRNFIVEPLEILLERYEKSKLAGDPTAILDKELEEWITSKYKNDAITLNEELNRIKIEPFIHYTIEQVFANYNQQEAQKKMLFDAFWRQADKSKEAEYLQKEFEEYCQEKMPAKQNIEDTTDYKSQVKKIPQSDGSNKYFINDKKITDSETTKMYEDSLLKSDQGVDKLLNARLKGLGKTDLGLGLQLKSGNF
jgi:hypothetical protein